MTNILMCFLVLFLAFVLMFKAKLMPTTEHFFDKNNSVAMRGFWCFIVVIVHMPEMYHNTIQDLIGSFGFVGVTFYFMTSAYGLKFGIDKKPDSIKHFWRSRLPKLLIPMFVGNVFALLGKLVQRDNVDFVCLVRFNRWVIWLLVCYFLFWLVYRFIKIKNAYKDALICALIATFSVLVYAFKSRINQTVWCPEVFGFAWGILLSNFKDRFTELINKSRIRNCIIFLLLSGAFGVAYLKLKTVAVFGDYILKIALGLAILLFILAVNTRVALGNKLNMFFGGISYEIFLLHGVALNLVAHFIPSLNAGLCILIALSLTVLLSWLVHLISNRIVKPIASLLQRTYKD